MKNETKKIFDTLFAEYPALEVRKIEIEKAFEVLLGSYKNGGKLLCCGNGGSAADSEHIVGELMKGFKSKRPLSDQQKKMFEGCSDGDYISSNLQGALPAISLVSHVGLATAYINDVEADLVFAQQVFGYMKSGDILIALSTSGNSKNVVYAAETSSALGGKVIAVTGEKESRLSTISDVCINLPSTDTAKIQEYTLPVYHALCAMLEEELF